jgi:hypothetical protein
VANILCPSNHSCLITMAAEQAAAADVVRAAGENAVRIAANDTNNVDNSGNDNEDDYGDDDDALFPPDPEYDRNLYSGKYSPTVNNCSSLEYWQRHLCVFDALLSLWITFSCLVFRSRC